MAHFAPASIEFTTIEITQTRSIIQTLIWTNTTHFTTTNAYGHALFLNNSDNSQHGPGIYLDATATLGIIPYQPITNLPGWYKQTRIGDPSFRTRFGLVTTAPTQLIDNRLYQIQWTTPPGSTPIDNGDIELRLFNKLFSDCNYRACLTAKFTCQVVDEWQIDPIPGSYRYTKPFHQCFDHNLFRLFIPWLIRQLQ